MTVKETMRRWSVERRLEFIDFRLYWEGQINRSDIAERFDVSVPQASKDIKKYQEFAPKNLDYDHRVKKYFAAQAFKPAFLTPDSEAYLWQMRDDISVMSGIDGAWLPNLPSHDIVRMPRRNVAPEILQKVVSAVKHEKAIEIFYQSMSSEKPAWRVVSPHTFAFDGMRWHVRAYCYNSKVYKDFLLSRIQKTRDIEDKMCPELPDIVWNTYFTLILKPHPKLTESQSKAVALDYEMKEDRLYMNIRLALLYYYLRRLGLQDCDGEQLESKEQHIVVANKEETCDALSCAQQKMNGK